MKGEVTIAQEHVKNNSDAWPSPTYRQTNFAMRYLKPVERIENEQNHH